VKVAVRDAAVLGALHPLDVAAYLRSTAWRPVDRIGDKGTVWTRAAPSGEELEILLPLRADLRDFTARMADVLTTLGAAEDRSQLDILRDITCSSADVVRLELHGSAVVDQSLPLPQGVLAFARAHELMLAAACAAVEPRAVYATRKPAQAVDYVSRLRLGQTEPGSYVVSILSPVAPSLDQAGGGPVEEPFERRVTTTLARATSAALHAAEVAGSTGELQPFLDATRLGVSANLCDALAGLVLETGAESLAVRLRWSPSRPPPAEVPSRVLFARDTAGVVREASRIFRETTPREEFELHGMVVALQRDEGAGSGTVTIAALVDGALRKVRVALGPEAYGAAIRAHQEEQRVRCLGRLIKEGRSLVLVDAHALEVAAGE
jgi:hypothetical protein